MKANPEYDFLIVGAGMFGAAFARMAADNGRRCLVVDKRDAVGGNAACEAVDGINVHKYGPHIFHTSDRWVWEWLGSMAPFNRFTNCPLALTPDGRLYHLPFNLNTFYELWGCRTPREAAEILECERRAMRERLATEGADGPRNLEEQAQLLIGPRIYELLIKGYTEKQWGRPCSQLPADIIKRLPVRLTYDNNYFNDKYQGIPIGGYNALFDSLLAGIEVRLGVDYLADRSALDALARHVVYTGPVDAYFDYEHGRLQWRSLRFETDVLDMPNYQGNAVVNYTSAEVPYTRVIECKHFECFGDEVYANPRTVVMREYPAEWTPGSEPYYPINDALNTGIYARYREAAMALYGVSFGGRLGTYSYLDMDKVVLQARALWEKLSKL